jgi:SNF2 family DNA or RNA helicase
MTLNWSAFESGVSFQYLHQGQFLPLQEWESAPIELGYAQQLFIQELLDNGQAEASEEALFISHDQICQFSNADLPLLNLPSRFKGDIRIDADGELGRSDFHLNWGFYEHFQGERLAVQRTGCILKSTNNNQSFLINQPQFELCQILEQFSEKNQQNRDRHQDWLIFAQIKTLAEKAGATLDSYLKNENVVVPEQIQLQLEKEEDDLTISPEIQADDASAFQQRFERFPRVQPTYTASKENGERIRFAFSPSQQQELEKVKKLSRVTGTEKQKILEHPEQFFDPDIIDLDLFSKRVLEIGLYKPKFYPFITPYKSQWIPGFLVETSDQDRQKIHFDTQEKLTEFKSAISHAQSNKGETVLWENLQIPIPEAQSILEISEKQWQQPEQPYKAKDKNGKKVLIIKENIENLEHEESQSQVAEEPVFIHRYSPPPHLKPKFQILNHQQEGIAWLQSLSLDGFSGALLADDMGLGKTLQGLSFIKWHAQKERSQSRTYLIVAPVSLLENWEAEYERFFDVCDLPMIKAYGQNLNELLGHSHWLQSVEALQQPQIVLTTYETLRRNQLVFCAVEWAVVLLDEAQKIKNPGTLITNSAKALKADFRLAATGTPVENTLVDLWCIMDFAVPGLLGSAKSFAQTYQNPLKSEDTDIAALGEQLRSQIGIHIKRRLKQDMLDELPEKKIHRLEKQMPQEQLERYSLALKQGLNQINKKNMLGILFAIRDISAHPYLLEPEIDHIPIEKLIQTSAKLQLVYQILEEIKSKQEKVIIFSERRETQRLLARVLQEKFAIRCSIINGDTPASKQNANSAKLSRQQAVDRFQAVSGFNAIVISQLAAGVGLNITKANHVIHYSRHWNPAKEEQANDRAYRIGQTKDVHVYLPMAVTREFKAFDLILDELLARKRALASASLFPTEQAEINPEEMFQQILSV